MERKENTKIILDYCQANGKSCPAAEYAASYSTEGTEAGDWYLPALAELKAIGEITYILDTSLSKIGGTLLPNTPQWSSTEKSSTGAWGSYFEDNMSSYGKVSCFFCSSCAGFLR